MPRRKKIKIKPKEALLKLPPMELDFLGKNRDKVAIFRILDGDRREVQQVQEILEQVFIEEPMICLVFPSNVEICMIEEITDVSGK